MRAPLLVVLLLLTPVVAATHPIERDVTGKLNDGVRLELTFDASGRVMGNSGGSERRGETVTTVTHSIDWAYSWGGTISLVLRPDGTLAGPAQLSGGAQGGLHSTVVDKLPSHTSRTQKDCEAVRDLEAEPQKGRHTGYGLLDADRGMLTVVVVGSAGVGGFPCQLTSDSGSGTSNAGHMPPITPLVTEGIALVKMRPDAFKAVGITADSAKYHLIFEIPLRSEYSILRGGATGAYPMDYDSSLWSSCMPHSAAFATGTCRQSGEVHVRLLVDPCHVAFDSRAVHLAEVKAVRAPSKGSSESQVRAFQVNVREKVNALFADERLLQLLGCDDGDEGTLTAAADAAQMVVDAWADVARTHGLSEQGKQDFRGAERQRQLVGASGDGPPELNSILAQAPGLHGVITAIVRSPVALHGWSDDGRHVGWNATTNAIDLQIENATFEGAPNGAQKMTLPSAAYKITIEELGVGPYALHLAWNGTGGEGFEMLALQAKAGRTMVANAVLDRDGILIGPAQRIATPEADAAFEFVERWAPLPGDPRPTSSGGTKAGPNAENGTPVPLAILIAAVASAAIIRSRRRD